MSSILGRVEWSDEEDPKAVYEAWKNRKALKRKRAPAELRKTRDTTNASSTRSGRIVGRKTKGHNSTERAHRYDESHNSTLPDDISDDEPPLSDALPDYIQSRKETFKKTQERLGEAGLKLPPDYYGVDFSDDERMESLHEKPVFNGLHPSAPYEDINLPYSAGVIPAPIAQWLRDYQVKGVEFLHELFVWQRGGILADDMGLGKTIQVIAFLTAAFGKTGDERDGKRMRKIRRLNNKGTFYPKVLIICPGGLMENWRHELSVWGWWEIYFYHGSQTIKEAALQAAKKGSVEIVITTYTTYRMNSSALNLVDWDCVIADECHIIKSRSSEITQAMNDINALCRIGLTGTAIQNKYEELWTLLNWTNPGRFGSLGSWKKCISEPLRMGQAHDATVEQLGKARKTADALVHHLLPLFFLRRTKTLIASQLPRKSDRVVFCPLTDTQADAYENYVSGDTIEYIKQSTTLCPCSSGKKRGWCCYMEIPGKGKWQNHVFPAIVALQKLSNHVALLIPSGTDSPDKQAKDLDNLQSALPNQWKELYKQKDSIINYSSPSFCGKWRILRRLLQFWHAEGDKVLVFSHSVRLLKMLQMLFSSTTSFNVSYLDGTMSYTDRTLAVQEFNESPTQFVFLISTRAGGVGLNITSANKVVVVDPNWNPAYDLQAQDRAYRIGQRRDVDVFRLISAGTIEEIVYARQIYKQQQANIGYSASLERRYFKGVQDRKEKKGEIFGLENLLSFREGVVLKDIVNKTNVAESRAGVEVVGMDLVGIQDLNDDLNESLTDLDENQTGAMSQIAEMIAQGIMNDEESTIKRPEIANPPRSDPIKAILAGAGVQYTHENSEVIGSSKVETKLSRNALQNENDVDLISKPVFAPTESQALVDNIGGQTSNKSAHQNIIGVKFRYHPPYDVRKRQFCTMARSFGFSDATEFALVVEGWTQSQRRDYLEKFYQLRRKIHQ